MIRNDLAMTPVIPTTFRTRTNMWHRLGDGGRSGWKRIRAASESRRGDFLKTKNLKIESEIFINIYISTIIKFIQFNIFIN